MNSQMTTSATLTTKTRKNLSLNKVRALISRNMTSRAPTWRTRTRKKNRSLNEVPALSPQTTTRVPTSRKTRRIITWKKQSPVEVTVLMGSKMTISTLMGKTMSLRNRSRIAPALTSQRMTMTAPSSAITRRKWSPIEVRAMASRLMSTRMRRNWTLNGVRARNSPHGTTKAPTRKTKRIKGLKGFATRAPQLKWSKTNRSVSTQAAMVTCGTPRAKLIARVSDRPIDE